MDNWFFQSYKQSFENGKLSPSQRQGIINLIPKKDKDLKELKSWHPLSILNCDYKILAKALSNRLKGVLHEIISPDQVGYMADRYFGENVRLIADVIDYFSYYDHPCLVFMADFEKAFDTVKWNFFKNFVKAFWFWAPFLQMDFNFVSRYRKLCYK